MVCKKCPLTLHIMPFNNLRNRVYWYSLLGERNPCYLTKAFHSRFLLLVLYRGWSGVMWRGEGSGKWRQSGWMHFRGMSES